MNHKTKIIALCILASIEYVPSDYSIAEAATCSCAGVPLSNSVDLMGLEPGQFEVGFTYTFTDISDLVAGTETINDETGRLRETQSYLMQTTYGINDDWAIIGVISWVEHRRNIATSNTADELSSGVGDSMIVVSYAPQEIDPFTRNEWGVGIGIRIPTGADNEGDPIIFAEDLQPGQGAWGSSLWFHYGHSFSQKSEWVFNLDASISDTNKNDREYSFEGEQSITAGFSYSPESDWSGSASFAYRKADPHTRFGSVFPNTGGKWLDFVPSVQYALTQKVTLSAAARIPVSRDLRGSLQFTTKNSFSLTINYLF